MKSQPAKTIFAAVLFLLGATACTCAPSNDYITDQNTCSYIKTQALTKVEEDTKHSIELTSKGYSAVMSLYFTSTMFGYLGKSASPPIKLDPKVIEENFRKRLSDIEHFRKINQKKIINTSCNCVLAGELDRYIYSGINQFVSGCGETTTVLGSTEGDNQPSN